MPERGLGDREVAQRAGRVGAQRLAERCQGEGAGGGLHEDADARQHPQDAVEGLRVRAHGPSEVKAAAGSIGELVGDAEARGDANGLAGPIAGDELEHDIGHRTSVVLNGLSHWTLPSLSSIALATFTAARTRSDAHV